MRRIVAILCVSIVAMSSSVWTGCEVHAGEQKQPPRDNPPCRNIRLGDVASARPAKLRRRYIVGKN
jgi:hypothetical protein